MCAPLGRASAALALDTVAGPKEAGKRLLSARSRVLRCYIVAIVLWLGAAALFLCVIKPNLIAGACGRSPSVCRVWCSPRFQAAAGVSHG